MNFAKNCPLFPSNMSINYGLRTWMPRLSKQSLWGTVSLTFWGWRNTLPGGLPGVLKNAGRPLDTMPLNRATCLDRWSERRTFALDWQAEVEGVDVCCLMSPRAMRERSGIWTTKKYELLACRHVSFTSDTLEIVNKHVQKWLNVVKWGVRQL